MLNYAELFEPILKVLWVSVRILGLWIFFPMFSNTRIPTTVRLCGALALSVALSSSVSPFLPKWSLQSLPTLAGLIFFVSQEFIFGAGMGLMCRWVFMACGSAAQWAGMQIGLSMGSVFNPEFDGGDSSWSELHHWIFILIFILIGGMDYLLEALVGSYRLELDRMWLNLGDPIRGAQLTAHMGVVFFEWVLKLAGPVVAAALLVQIALGVLSKFVPQFNVWALSASITIGFGLMLLYLMLPSYVHVLNRFSASTIESLSVWTKFVGAR